MRKCLLKFRVSRVIPTFHSCRSKISTSTSTSTHPSSFKRHVSSAISSARHACLRPPSSPPPSHTQLSSPTTKQHHSFFKWIRPKHPQWHFNNYDSTPPRRKIYNSSASDHENDVVLLPPITKHRVSKRRHHHRTTKRRATKITLKNNNKARISTSSDSPAGIFTDDEDQTETLVSTDSTSPFKSKEREIKRSKQQHNNKRRSSFESSPARLSEFMRKVGPCREIVDGKVRESFAVVKKSQDPYEDFRTSMAEMVVEKQMFEEKELEELLRCFLSLNSEKHHETIVRAFTDIWKGLFSHSTLSSTQ